MSSPHPSPTIYASRLARLPVVAPDGDSIGIVADVVIGPPRPGSPPPIYGLVVTVPGRNVFLGVGRIAAIEADGVRMSSGSVAVRRFARRPSEVLALAQLIDQPVPGDPAGGRINDIGLARSPRRAVGWEVVSVDVVVSSGRGLTRRRADHHVVGAEALRPLLGTRDAYHQLRELHPADAAERVLALPDHQRATAARTLDDEQLADLIEELPNDVQRDLLSELGIERAADVLEAMQPDDAADVLGDLPTTGRSELLAAMRTEDAEMMRRLLVYGGDSAGGLMNPEPVVAMNDDTVAAALAALRDPDIAPAMAAQVYVVEAPAQTPTGAYLGQVGTQRLLREPPSRRLGVCLDPAPEPLLPGVTAEVVAQHLASYNLVATPIIDDEGRLVGTVTIDDVLDHLLPDDWRRR